MSLENETESLMSGEGSHQYATPHRSLMSPDVTSRNPLERVDSSVLPNDSASHNGENSPSHSALNGPASEEAPFPFKFKAPSGRVHRLQVIVSAGITELVANVTAKLGGEVEAVGGEATVMDGKLGKSGYALSYLDNEGDTVSITTDRDLLDAITLARQGQRDKVDLFVHDPEKPPLSATVDPRPVIAKIATPPRPASTVRERRRVFPDDDPEDQEETPLRRERHIPAIQTKQELIPGVPNDLLLPGAVAAFAVVIIGVFVLGRSSNR